MKYNNISGWNCVVLQLSDAHRECSMLCTVACGVCCQCNISVNVAGISLPDTGSCYSIRISKLLH